MKTECNIIETQRGVRVELTTEWSGDLVATMRFQNELVQWLRSRPAMPVPIADATPDMLASALKAANSEIQRLHVLLKLEYQRGVNFERSAQAIADRQTKKEPPAFDD